MTCLFKKIKFNTLWGSTGIKYLHPPKAAQTRASSEKGETGDDGVQAEGEITRWWEVELTYACIQICVYWRWDRSDNEASWRLFSSSRRSLEINGPQTHGDKTSSTHLLSDWKAPEPSNATSAPFAHAAVQRADPPPCPHAPTAQRLVIQKVLCVKKRPDPLYPQTKPPKPSKSQRGITLTTLSKHWYSTNQQILQPCIQPALILQHFPNKSCCRWRAARTTRYTSQTFSSHLLISSHPT